MPLPQNELKLKSKEEIYPEQIVKVKNKPTKIDAQNSLDVLIAAAPQLFPKTVLARLNSQISNIFKEKNGEKDIIIE